MKSEIDEANIVKKMINKCNSAVILKLHDTDKQKPDDILCLILMNHGDNANANIIYMNKQNAQILLNNLSKIVEGEKDEIKASNSSDLSLLYI